jgi:hypothetical protein
MQYPGSDTRDPFMSSNQGWRRVISKSLACALAATALLAVFTASAVAATEEAPPSPPPSNPQPYFYHNLDYGSESQFNPISNFINYGLDTLQVKKDFDGSRFGTQFRKTVDNLSDPVYSIDRNGDIGSFINRQIIPYDLNNLDESAAMIPNYALHLLGGGMVYRKNVEWLQSRGYKYPRTLAVLQGMTAELLQEVVEKKSTTAEDPVADFFIFRPAGMLLFENDDFAEFAAQALRLAEWPYQPMYNPGQGRFVNVGENFLVRPTFLAIENHSLFAYFGMTVLLGASHKVSFTDAISWGVGGAVTNVEHYTLKTRPCGGIFYDRNGSLLSSLILNGTEDLKVRFNLYPGAVTKNQWFPGIYLGVGDKGDVVVGLTLRVLPLGGAFGSN